MKIRKAHAVVAATLAVGLTLTACSSSGSTASSSSASATPVSGSASAISGTVTGVWDVAYKAALEPVVQAFEKENPGVTVDINYAGGDVGSLISTQLQAGTAPDLMLAFPGGTAGAGANLNVIPLASQGKLLPVTSEWASTIPDQWKADFNYEDKTYAYPGAVQGLGAIYNKTKMDELGLKVPETLSDVYALCKSAKDAGLYAYAQGLGDTGAGPQMLSFAQTGTLVYGPDPDFTQKQTDGTATFKDSEGWKTQLGIYQKMYDEGCFGEGALGRSRQQGQDAVAAGQALALVDVGAVTAGMHKSAPNATFVMTAMPASDTAADNRLLALPIYSLVVNAQAKNPTAAMAFLDFLAKPENSNTFANGFNQAPLIPNDSFVASDELKPLSEAIQSGEFTKLPAWPDAGPQVALNEGVQGMLLGETTPDDLLQKMDDAFQSAGG